MPKYIFDEYQLLLAREQTYFSRVQDMFFFVESALSPNGHRNKQTRQFSFGGLLSRLDVTTSTSICRLGELSVSYTAN